ncbi:hypothetical protein [Streptomyces tailanensis]|uniref:hypothetical protein n=1 Tax=Streptomyces tailanensis TaxID=2569858 RepID=UPI00319EAA82
MYSVADRRRVSRTLWLGRGSCSQRMAALEAVARAVRVRTRVRGLLVDGAFWYPRFPRLKPFVPEQVPLAWPEFRISGAWLPVGELFTAPTTDRPFANKGGETLFDAVARTGIHWDGAPDTAPHLRRRRPPLRPLRPGARRPRPLRRPRRPIHPPRPGPVLDGPHPGRTGTGPLERGSTGNGDLSR